MCANADIQPTANSYSQWAAVCFQVGLDLDSLTWGVRSVEFITIQVMNERATAGLRREIWYLF